MVPKWFLMVYKRLGTSARRYYSFETADQSTWFGQKMWEIRDFQCGTKNPPPHPSWRWCIRRRCACDVPMPNKHLGTLWRRFGTLSRRFWNYWKKYVEVRDSAQNGGGSKYREIVRRFSQNKKLQNRREWFLDDYTCKRTSKTCRSTCRDRKHFTPLLSESTPTLSPLRNHLWIYPCLLESARNSGVCDLSLEKKISLIVKA